MPLLKLLKEEISDSHYELYELRDEIMINAITEIAEAESDEINQDGTVLKLSQVQRVGSQFMKDGYVRNEKALERIAKRVIHNILKISVNNDLSGHTSAYPTDEIEMLGYANNHREAEDLIRNIWDKRIYNYIYDEESGQMRISDYAMKPLSELSVKIAEALEDYEYKKVIMYVDRVFNTVHQRSDISKGFIDGGNRSLDQLSDKY